MHLVAPLPLACGLVLPTGLARAAMTEPLAVDGAPDDRLDRLTARFAAGGAALLWTLAHALWMTRG